MAQTLTRTVDHMYDWDRDRKNKVFEMKRLLARDKRDQDMLEIAKGGRFVGEGSKRYLSKKENVEK